MYVHERCKYAVYRRDVMGKDEDEESHEWVSK